MDRHLPIPRSTWILLFLLPPLGWWLLSRGDHSPARRLLGYVASGIFVGMVVVGSFMDKPPASTAGGMAVSQPSPETPAAPPPPDAPVAAHEQLCTVVPAELDGFVLVSVQGLLATAPRCGTVEYEPVGDSPFSVALFVSHPNEHSLEEEIGSAGTSVDVGPHAARLTRSADTSETGVHWKQGDWLFAAFVRPGAGGQTREARQAALRVATAVSEWATPAVAGLAPAEERARIVALDAALDSQAAAQARAQRNVRRMMAQAPDWVESIALERGTLSLTVAPLWTRLPVAIRRSQAVAVWRDWARINTPADMDASIVEFRTRAGERLGGSGIQGSSISFSE
jgi:hypothetical protein